MREIAARRRAELDALVAAHGGSISPSQVVEFARDPNTALHTVFEWDDTVAAQRFREVQAAHYIRAVVKTLPTRNDRVLEVRAFVALTPDRGTVSFRPVESVLDDPVRRAQLVADAFAELNAVRQKYSHLTELAAVWAAMDRPMEAAA